MTIEEIIKIREDFENVKKDILELACNMYEKVDSILSCMKRAERQEQKLSQEEFAIWIQHGITPGAVFYVDGLSEDTYTVTGISCNGFVAKDKNGKEYILTSRMLKSIEKFKVVER